MNSALEDDISIAGSAFCLCFSPTALHEILRVEWKWNKTKRNGNWWWLVDNYITQKVKKLKCKKSTTAVGIGKYFVVVVCGRPSKNLLFLQSLVIHFAKFRTLNHPFFCIQSESVIAWYLFHTGILIGLFCGRRQLCPVLRSSRQYRRVALPTESI